MQTTLVERHSSGQVESWRRSLSRKRWHWIRSAMMRSVNMFPSCFHTVSINLWHASCQKLFWHQRHPMLQKSSFISWPGSSIEAPRGWIGRSPGQAEFQVVLNTKCKSKLQFFQVFLLLVEVFFFIFTRFCLINSTLLSENSFCCALIFFPCPVFGCFYVCICQVAEEPRESGSSGPWAFWRSAFRVYFWCVNVLCYVHLDSFYISA